MKILSKFWSAAILLVVLAGCFTTGRNFPSDVDWLVKDKTTKEDVELMLGSPSAVGNSGGVTTWTYGYYTYKMGGTYYKELKIYWNPNHTMQHFSFTSSFPGDIGSKPKGKDKPMGAPARAR